MTRRRRGGGDDATIAAALRAGFNAAVEARVVIGSDGALLAVNAAFAGAFGRPHVLHDLFVSEAEALRTMAALGAAFGGASATGEADLRRSDGKQFLARFSAVASGEALLIAIVESAADSPNGTASDRQRRVDVERLAGGIAHDFRNVLAVIRGNVEIAEQRSEDPRVKSLLIEATRAAGLGAAMTDQLLAFAHRRRAPAAPIDVAEALLAIAPMLRAAAGPAIDVTIAAKDAGRISADKTELERVIINLVANARAAISGAGHVTVAAKPAALDAPRQILSGLLDAGRYVCISVADSGVGMAPGVLARAIDPFFTTKPPGEGFGLGLSLAHDFAIDAGGGLDLRSRPGRGTTATLYLKQML